VNDSEDVDITGNDTPPPTNSSSGNMFLIESLKAKIREQVAIYFVDLVLIINYSKQR
jgi:hypothetical protein